MRSLSEIYQTWGIRTRNLLMGFGFLVLATPFGSPAVHAERQADASAGRAVFLQRCAACHGPDASGNTPVAEALDTTIPDYRSERVQSLRDRDIQIVVAGGWGKMPAVEGLSSQNITNVIAYIRTFAVKPRASMMGQGDSLRGEKLFSGRIHLKNGGPACYLCHNIRNLPFPGGGTMGPDLTRVYSRLGTQGLKTALQTKYFPTMAPLYNPHRLTVEEQADLYAFLKTASAEPPSPDTTLAVFIIALVGSVVLILLTGVLWSRRLQGVRRRLVKHAATAS